MSYMETVTGIKRRVTLWELLCWAYRVQRVAGSAYEAMSDSELLYWPSRSTDGCVSVARIAAIGSDIDGGGYAYLNDRMHQDASAVYDVVQQDKTRADLIERFALAGCQPVPSLAVPRPGPTVPVPAADQWRWEVVPEDEAGKPIRAPRFRVKISFVGYDRERIQRYKGTGRRRVANGWRPGAQVEVYASPLSWEPSFEMVNWANDEARYFAQQLELVAARLGQIGLKSHELVGLGLEYDLADVPGRIRFGEAAPDSRVDVDLRPVELRKFDGSTRTLKPYRRWVSATHHVDKRRNGV